MKLAGKTALVTGAGRGIGKGIALALAEAGADLVINDRPGSPDLESAAEQIRQSGCHCTTIEADAFSRTGCEQLAEQAGDLDILVSNPAFSRRETFLDYPAELFEQTLQGTLVAGFHISQLVARRMVERGEGGKVASATEFAEPTPASV